MKTSTKKTIFNWGIITSIALMILGSTPWTVKRSSYSATWSYIMGVTGLIGMVIMTRQTVLGIRAIWGKWIEDFFWVNGLHKWLGIGSFASIIIHPIASVIAYGTTRLFMFSLDFDSKIDTYISLGKIAFDLIIAVFVTSVVVRKMLRYKVWHTIHLITYIAIGLVWFHGYFSGTMITTKPFIQYYWLIIGGILAAVLVYRILFHWGVGKVKGTVAKVTHLTHLVTEYQIRLDQEITSEPGQFVYIQLKQGGDSHPFSIVEQHGKDLVLAFRHEGNFTKLMAEQHEDISVWIDGPYGNFGEVCTDTDKIICIASGIGITPFLSIIDQYKDSHQIIMIYQNSTRESAIYLDKLQKKLGDQLHVIFTRENNQQSVNEYVGKRIDSSLLSAIISSDKLHKSHYYICGSTGVIKSCIDSLNHLGVYTDQIHHEAFNM